MSRPLLTIALSIPIAIFGPVVQAQETEGHDKHLDIQSSVGDLHLGNDADARKTGLPLYPGARVSYDEDDNNAVNLGLLTDAFGLKLVVAKYESDDSPGKVIDYYRERLKKYGKVVECHTQKHADHANIDDDKNSKDLKCEGDNTGPVTELKVGTQSHQHVVAIEPEEGRGGSTFTLVYVHAHGKQGDI